MSVLTLPASGFSLDSYLGHIEACLIAQAMIRADGNVSQAAKTLGLNRTTLSEKMRRYHRHTGLRWQRTVTLVPHVDVDSILASGDACCSMNAASRVT